MRCPFCGTENTAVKDSRPAEENTAVRRRRACEVCGGRFTTFERVQLRDIMVVKRDGKRAPFDREKVARSVKIALRKRPVDAEQIDQMVSGIIRQLESAGDGEIDSNAVGELVM
ncbi:MAG: transcriptional regulator NrdR, partial [Pseudomonadota bacterium]